MIAPRRALGTLVPLRRPGLERSGGPPPFAQVDVFDYQLLYTSFFTDSEQRNLNTPDPSTGLMGAQLHPRLSR